MKRLLNYIKNLFTKPIEEKLADALHKLTAKKYKYVEDAKWRCSLQYCF